MDRNRHECLCPSIDSGNFNLVLKQNSPGSPDPSFSAGQFGLDLVLPGRNSTAFEWCMPGRVTERIESRLSTDSIIFRLHGKARLAGHEAPVSPYGAENATKLPRSLPLLSGIKYNRMAHSRVSASAPEGTPSMAREGRAIP